MTTKHNLFEGGSNFDWASYMRVRPDYTQSGFYDELWTYHKRKGGQWECVHDVGAGPGNISQVLAQRFKQVNASDLSDFHMNVAAERLSKLGNVSFNVCRGEEVAEHHPAGSADMIVLGESFALMSPQKALAAFAKLLRPGGTLAIWYYGGPLYDDEQVQALQLSISSRSYDEFRPYEGTYWEPTAITLARRLDNIGFSEEDWTGIERTKWNPDDPFFFGTESDFDFEVPKASAIRPDEVCREIVDRKFWEKTVDFPWAKSFIDALIPRKKDYITPEVRGMYEEMEALMGGPEKKHNICFPAVLILATKK